MFGKKVFRASLSANNVDYQRLTTKEPEKEPVLGPFGFFFCLFGHSYEQKIFLMNPTTFAAIVLLLIAK